MSRFPIYFLFFIILSCGFLFFTSNTAAAAVATNNRRALHQPFFPEDSNPPTQPPSPQPPTPKEPFSTTTPNNPSFFPSIPSPPSSPSPPSPSSLASFPANISSLTLPQSPQSKPSSKLISVAIVLSLFAVILAGISVFLCIRHRRRKNYTDDKSSRSEISNGIALNVNGLPHLRRSAPNSSEFLYLGNIATSRSGAGGSDGGGDVDLRKLDSPELRPLPPLLPQSFRQNYSNAEVGSEDEEFYTPSGSSGGRETSIRTGSTSRTTVVEENYDIKRRNGSTWSLYSSSNSGSPSSSSPPVSLSPIRSRPKSPELMSIRTVPPPNIMTQLDDLKSSPSLSTPLSSSPERSSEKSLLSSPGIPYVAVQNAARISPNHQGNAMSPFLSPFLPPPERPLEETHDVLLRISNVSNQNVESTVRPISANSNQLASEKNVGSRSRSLSSPERDIKKTHDSLPRISNVSNFNVETPVSSSATLGNKKNSRSPSLSPLSFSSPERSTGITYVSNPNVESPVNLNGVACKNSRSPSASSLSSSPERHLEKNTDSSSGISHVSNQKTGSPGRISNAIPPQLPHPRRHWNVPFFQNSSPLEKTHDLSFGKSNVLNQNLEKLANKKHSRSPSQSSLSSPESSLEKIKDSSKRISNVSNVGSPARIDKCTLPPPPPPPPPLLLLHSQWENPVSTPSVPPIILKPPVLASAQKPATIPPPTMISPIELLSASSSENADEGEDIEKPKLKPLHWDKVRASSDREMVWDQLKSSSFKVNEEMIETLFVVNKPISNHKEATRRYVFPSPSQENRVLDPKKAQNIAISLRALNVTIEEVCEALSEGNADALGAELLESLLKMAPTKEEERRLKAYKDDSPFKLGPAEKFLKAVLDIPCAFKRADAMLYIANFEYEVEYLKKTFETLEAACEELRNSRMFFKLLEAVLKTGNRMNVGTKRGDAHAFKLDTLLKLVDVKGADGKTTLLHFVVQEIIRTEGARLSSGDQNTTSSINDDAKCRKVGLQVVSDLTSELKNVKKSAAMDSDILSSDVMKLFKGIGNIAEIVQLNEEMGSEESIQKFSESMKRFMKTAEVEIIRIQAQESVSLSLVKEITEYFHGNSAMEEAHPFRIFMVVRDFLTILDRVCKEVGMINERTIVSSAHKFPVPVNPMMQPLINGFPGRRQYSFSDDENSSP